MKISCRYPNPAITSMNPSERAALRAANPDAELEEFLGFLTDEGPGNSPILLAENGRPISPREGGAAGTIICIHPEQPVKYAGEILGCTEPQNAQMRLIAAARIAGYKIFTDRCTQASIEHLEEPGWNYDPQRDGVIPIRGW